MPCASYLATELGVGIIECQCQGTSFPGLVFSSLLKDLGVHAAIRDDDNTVDTLLR